MMIRFAILLFFVAFGSFGAVNPDVMPVEIKGFGLPELDESLLARFRVRLSLSSSDDDTFSNEHPETKLRIFATNTINAVALGSGDSVLLDISGTQCPWIGNNSSTIWVEGLKHGASASLVSEVFFDGNSIGRDSLRIRVAPFLVLSNSDVAEKIYVATIGGDDWSSFFNDMQESAAGIVEIEETIHIPFPQDVAELGWSGISNGRKVVWSMERNGFSELLSQTVGCFYSPHVSGMGGNVEATPPCSRYPNGLVVVGNTLPEVAVDFLKQQSVQTTNGNIVVLPVEWLKVGHVDEVVSFIPTGENGFSILIADLDRAIFLLREELNAVNTWMTINGQDDDMLTYKDAIEELLYDYELSENVSKVSAIHAKLSVIKETLKQVLGMSDDAFHAIPVLFSLPESLPMNRTVAARLPNQINLVALKNEAGNRRLLIPNAECPPFLDDIQTTLSDLGYQMTEYRFIDTSGPHFHGGEAHCASSVLRRRNP